KTIYENSLIWMKMKDLVQEVDNLNQENQQIDQEEALPPIDQQEAPLQIDQEEALLQIDQEEAPLQIDQEMNMVDSQVTKIQTIMALIMDIIIKMVKIMDLIMMME